MLLIVISEKTVAHKSSRFDGRSVSVLSDHEGFHVRLDYRDIQARQYNGSVLVGEAYNQDFNPMDVKSLDVNNIEKYYGDFLYLFIKNNSAYVYLNQNIRFKIYYCDKKDYLALSTDIKTLAAFCNIRPAMNWPYIETFVRYGDISGTATPFDNINELPMGCMLNKKRFSASVICEPEWNPVKYVNSAFDSRDWIEEFSKRIGHSINTHTSDIFIELSGGLDSALMSAMLQCTKFANVYAINLYNQDDFQSNETDYAKFVAAHLGLQLDFLETSSALPFTPVGFDRKPDKPQTTWSHMAELKLIIEYIRARSDDYTILHGFGGDSMMHQTPSHDFVIDALLCAGFKKARKTALLLSDYYSKSYLYNMFQYLRILKSYLLKKKLFLYFNAPVNSWQKQYSHDLFQFLHPYLQVLKHQKVIPGKAHQIEEFFYSLASISPKEHRYYPYLTKEVFEIALKMPAYQTFNNQYNRIHQREMLRALIGENISMRKTKGHATQTFFKGFQKNIRAVEAYCLEGRLVKEGIVDKKILEKNISIAYHGVMEKIWGIKNLYCAEIFLSEWEK